MGQPEQADGAVVTRLFITPIKGFALSEPEQITLNGHGAVGDRDFFLADENDQLFSITRSGNFASWRAQFDADASRLRLTSAQGATLDEQVTTGPDQEFEFVESRKVSGAKVQGPWSEWLSKIAGKPVWLVRATSAGDGYDEKPVTLLAEESVAELARATGVDPIDVRRFRMLINVTGIAPYEEDTWNDRTVTIGTARLQMSGPVPRCAATTRDPDSGTKDLKTLALIAESRGMQPNDFGEGLNMGVYADILETGTIRVGDRVILE